MSSKIDDMNSKCIEDITQQESEINRGINRMDQITTELKMLLESNDVSLALIYKSKNEEFRCPVQYKITLPIFTPQIINREQFYKRRIVYQNCQHFFQTGRSLMDHISTKM